MIIKYNEETMDSVRKVQKRFKFVSYYNGKNRKSKNICIYLFRRIIIYKMQDTGLELLE